ncbi:MAG: nitrogen fixation protein NifQ [Candidatus Accumulibacter phosphatis]|jgi:nitrogen fixation protein NifQ|uniref:nitrogen fixation protein NifQ n=1 Tax=Candidatus Accumulibacter sp. ACC012 TaxID=2823332 RepID=UPI0025B92C17|nr:nitrogen fixation protein NifQ [Candidatus Accumulibacter sp. ACC012]
MNAPDRLPWPAILPADLLALPASTAASDPNRFLFARMIASQAAYAGCLPDDLGLGAKDHRQLLADFFPGYAATAREAGRRIEQVPEWSELHQLLLDHRAGERHSEAWIAATVATACAGCDHLWQDLGLIDRDELTALMWLNFPELAAANSGDMKWKKFLYRQFCSREGIYVCPAPSCGECKDYTECFAPEN